MLILEKWEGLVTEVDKDSFVAEVKKNLYAIGPRERVEFDLIEVSDADLGLLVIGARFYWTVGYRDEVGQRSRFSALRFQRLPLLSEDSTLMSI